MFTRERAWYVFGGSGAEPLAILHSTLNSDHMVPKRIETYTAQLQEK